MDTVRNPTIHIIAIDPPGLETRFSIVLLDELGEVRTSIIADADHLLTMASDIVAAVKDTNITTHVPFINAEFVHFKLASDQ